jgi:hypothetical protein
VLYAYIKACSEHVPYKLQYEVHDLVLSRCTQINPCIDAPDSIGQNRVCTYVCIPYLVYNYLCTRVGAKLRVFYVQGDNTPFPIILVQWGSEKKAYNLNLLSKFHFNPSI